MVRSGGVLLDFVGKFSEQFMNRNFTRTVQTPEAESLALMSNGGKPS